MGYRQGWKHQSVCEFIAMEASCLDGKLIQVKTVWYGKTLPRKAGCTWPGNTYMPPGGCSTNEFNIRLFTTEHCLVRPAALGLEILICLQEAALRMNSTSDYLQQSAKEKRAAR
ncbi:hypothetical protein GE061_018475 [Apolygus lucorum]|uniref:Uncharacterized protein n=1 Tax=Apolygus lucorum TaxID=248454 RepID=A0A8S9XFC5_APOLU|nr:hypothetical protein GE061_018475 [Apolygus lucorum]